MDRTSQDQRLADGLELIPRISGQVGYRPQMGALFVPENRNGGKTRIQGLGVRENNFRKKVGC